MWTTQPHTMATRLRETGIVFLRYFQEKNLELVALTSEMWTTQPHTMATRLRETGI
ncbi:unnamed protein product [Larinioides sclopetarius]|uniref:Uncharacterized protein n=1 Tax=Larinioides sclopetarius TaxID=280406 RepID=A0AAV1ZGI0_9ARAC